MYQNDMTAKAFSQCSSFFSLKSLFKRVYYKQDLKLKTSSLPTMHLHCRLEVRVEVSD